MPGESEFELCLRWLQNDYLDFSKFGLFNNMFFIFEEHTNISKLLNEMFIIIKTEIFIKIRESANMGVVSGLVKEYKNFISEDEANNIFLEMYLKLKPGESKRMSAISIKEFLF